MQTHHHVEPVFLNDLHLDAAKQLAKLDALGGRLALADRRAEALHFFPVLPPGALFVAPELGARVQRRPVGERFLLTSRGPVRGAARQVLRHVVAEEAFIRERLDRPDVQAARRRNPSFRHRQHVVDRLHRARPEGAARCKFRRLNRGGELGEDRLARAVQAIEELREENRDELDERPGVTGPHVLDLRIVRPERIRRVDQRRAEMCAENLVDFLRGGRGDRLVRLDAGEREHRLADDADAHPLERPWRSG